MTRAQKALVLGSTALLVGAGLYQADHASRLRREAEPLQNLQAAQVAQVGQLQRETEAALRRSATANEEVARRNHEAAELPRLQGEVLDLRRQLTALEAQIRSGVTQRVNLATDSALQAVYRQGIAETIKARLSPVLRELKLGPTQARQVVATLADAAWNRCSRLLALPRGALTPDQIQRFTAESEAESKALVQPILGEAGWSRLRDFSYEWPVQSAVDSLNAQLGASQLSEEQNRRLFAAIKAEPFDLIRNLDGGGFDPAFWGPQDYIDKHLLEIAECNRRILGKAGVFLSPEQSSVLSTLLSNGINAQLAWAAAYVQKP